jgi:hypothetical protein
MGVISLLGKELREHTLALVMLACGLLVVVLILIAQQVSGEFNLSVIETVRFSLMSVIPLIAIIVGNRLIVREYIGGTRQFVEALPVGNALPLTIKYILGFIFINTLAAAVLGIAVLLSSNSEGLDNRFLLLVLTKTLTIATLLWSLVFFISITGRIRIICYVALGMFLLFLINSPNFDQALLAPIGLMDRQLFVFERDIIPWSQLIQTWLLSALLVAAGYVLALVNEGSLVEKLSKPISKRDIAVLVLVVLASVTLYQTLAKTWDVETFEFGTSNVVRFDDPPIAVMYLEPEQLARATQIATLLKTVLGKFKTDLGLTQLPTVRIELNTELEHTEIEPDLVSGVLVTANYLDYDAFEDKGIAYIAMHHSLLSLSNSRMDFETRHWILDGLSRWWTESANLGTPENLQIEHNAELMALAVHAARRYDKGTPPLLLWQTLTDELGFEMADALSYTAIKYLEQERGFDVVIRLASDYVNEKVGNTSIESFKRLAVSDEARFEKLTGWPLREFIKTWLIWLEDTARIDSVAAKLNAIPDLQAQVKSVVNEKGVRLLEGSYRAGADYKPGEYGQCVLRHQPTPAFDIETSIYSRVRDRRPCVITGVAHLVEPGYAVGERAYVVLELESDEFHRPIPLWAGRVVMQ